MQLFSADATMFCFAHENIKKTPSKVAHNRPQTFFSSTGPAAQTSPELIFHIIKMSQQASVLLFVCRSYPWIVGISFEDPFSKAQNSTCGVGVIQVARPAVQGKGVFQLK